MQNLTRNLFAVLLAVLVALPAAYAQERPTYSRAELDQMLAPIALYPDATLSQVLMASTYPLEVVEAARWSRENPGLRGDDAVRAAEEKDWDPSVKSLLAFPDLLARMNEQLEWTKQLGDAFLAQEDQVMEAVQGLRQKARAAGQLAPDERVRVVEDGSNIVIEPANPRVVYVPYYDPWVVYGPWWWSAYPPVVWAPWPGYVAHRPGIWWGAGVGISAGIFFGSVDWSHRHVRVGHVHSYYARPPVARRGVSAHRPLHPGRWEHNPSHRRGVVYRSPEVHKRFAAGPQRRELRNETRAPAGAPAQRRFERPERRHEPRHEPRHEQRRDDRRGQAMPPAFRSSNPQPRAEARPERAERRAERPQADAPARRAEAPERRVERRVERPQPDAPARRAQAPERRVEAPRAVQPRMGVQQQQQPRPESRQQMRREPRDGGDGNGRGRSGNSREQGGRGNGRN